MATALKTWTVEDLLAMPDNGVRHELVRGELIEMPQPGDQHGRLQARVAYLLINQVEEAGLGTVMTDNGVVVTRGPDTVLGPDVAVYLGEVVAPLEETVGFGDRIPDIVVEIVSPSNSAPEIYDKSQQYLEAGVQAVVAVWPDRVHVTVETIRGRTPGLRIDEVLDLTDIAPGVAIPISAIFGAKRRSP